VCLLTMDNSQDSEVELCEEMINDAHYVLPPVSSPHSPQNVIGPLPSQDPMKFHDNTLTSFTATLRPALRSETNKSRRRWM